MPVTCGRTRDGQRGSGSLGDMQQYLQGIEFPANNEEAAPGPRATALPRISSIRNAAAERFNGPEEVLQTIQGS